MEDDFARAAKRQQRGLNSGREKAQRRQDQLARAAALADQPVVAPNLEPAPCGPSESTALPRAREAPALATSGGACFMCVEPFHGDEWLTSHSCVQGARSGACSSCAAAWAASRMAESAAGIPCWRCDQLLSGAELAMLPIPAEIMDAWGAALCKHSLQCQADFVWCPHCPWGGFCDLAAVQSPCEWQCPICEKRFTYCPFCKRDHLKASCKRYIRGLRGLQETERERSEAAIAQTAKFCPSCGVAIERKDGCKYINCANCRRFFCWWCGKLLKKDHEDHDCSISENAAVASLQLQEGDKRKVSYELNRLFLNVLDMDQLEALNVGEGDCQDLQRMLAASAEGRGKYPCFIESECDGELIVHIPFASNVRATFEVTHVVLHATHPGGPGRGPPTQATILANRPTAGFGDDDDATAVRASVGFGRNVISVERQRGPFKSCSHLSIFVARRAGDDAEVFLNGISIFGLPAPSGRGQAGPFASEALIVNPELHDSADSPAA
mmetsp:Transcript_9477/g.24091  ORF Transcript_9477/g.24091 Transcript_9477/m.24091 type:complete len:498 (+) Transcript_9477:1034-2527(+)